ncbi:MAG: hypothetical protein HC894_06510 [Microcoleus sp. SM1_3_4]|nr:hypothetical protein [Microcoleus sp. SM1_3_4]
MVNELLSNFSVIPDFTLCGWIFELMFDLDGISGSSGSVNYRSGQLGSASAVRSNTLPFSLLTKFFYQKFGIFSISLKTSVSTVNLQPQIKAD